MAEQESIEGRYRRLFDAMWGGSAPPYQAPVSEYTTPADVQRERISGALGWDVGPVDSWAPEYAAREVGNRAWQLGLAPAAPGAAVAAAAKAAPRVWRAGLNWRDIAPQQLGGKVPDWQYLLGVGGAAGAGRVAYDSAFGTPPHESLYRWLSGQAPGPDPTKRRRQ